MRKECSIESLGLKSRYFYSFIHDLKVVAIIIILQTVETVY